jgi:hypothetical protein
MKNNSRNGVIFFMVLILAIIGYSIIHVYCKGVKNDISSGGVVYENNRKKQPVNNIVAIKKYKPGKPTKPTAKPTVDPTIEPTIEPSTIPTVTPTVKPTVKPTTKPKPKPTPTPKQEDVSKNIVFEYNYENGNYIYLVNQFPIADEVGKNLQGDKRTNDFKLKFNQDAVGVKYTITVEKLDGSTLDDEWVKLFLVKDGGDIRNCYRPSNRIKTYNEYSKYKNKNNEKIIYEGVISSAEASRGYIDFTFRMWVSEDLQLNKSNYLSESRTYRTRVNVYAQE